jgi:ribonucleoside-diphosphate reductase alpha chain
MFGRKISKIVKRDGRIVNFDRNKIASSVAKAAVSLGENPNISTKTVNIVEKSLFKNHRGRLPTVENVQRLVENVLTHLTYLNVAEVYSSYGKKKIELRKTFSQKDKFTKFNINSLSVLHSRYLLKNKEGTVIETPIDMFRRVARVIAHVDNTYSGDIFKSEKEFFEIMYNLEFLPNSPCLMNAGTSNQQLSACFVFDIQDSIKDIFDTLKIAAMVQKTGGGTGFNFSNIRQKGSIVEGTKGIASGPVSFIGVFDKMTDVVKLGAKRRGANMGVLRVDHPDILEFISSKKNQNELTNFNISVAATSEFMEAVIANKNYNLIDPRTKGIIGNLNARHVFDSIVNNSWESGDPGLIFIDRINEKHFLPEKIVAVNPCGEQPLLDNESCVLGSLNLTKFVNGNEIDWQKLKKIIPIAVRFLDNVIDANEYVTIHIEEATLANRKIGLGVMGWADMLIMLGIPYNTNEAVKLASELMEFINEHARNASSELGRLRGNFPNFSKSKLYNKYKFARNATVTTIAPTGSISIIANSCSSGIEPLFAVSYVRDILDGTKLLETNSLFDEVSKKYGFYSKEIAHEISHSGSLQKVKIIPKDIKKLFITALDINPTWHVKMQAAFQKYTENGVSKTINLRPKAKKEEIYSAYLEAYKLGCKGITVFRYGSKRKQVLYAYSTLCIGVECGN